ncbi:MAG TPA: hypothetical protein DCS55_16495 [Acidimicrobiaceae bacterium]|nr:hypothetical protein [Acidimicrobiaceae bacterium]
MPEHESADNIIQWFQDHGFTVSVHQDQPPRPEPDTLSTRLSSMWPEESTHWCELRSDEIVLRWYGSGASADDALRSARRRYRTEEESSPPGSQRLS